MAKQKKRGKLSEVELDFIKNNKTIPIKVLAEKLNRTEEIVKKTLAEMPVEPETTTVTKDDNRVTNIMPVGKLMGKVKHKTGDKNPIGTVMTEAASERADDFRQKLGSKVNRHTKDAIFKPLGENPDYD